MEEVVGMEMTLEDIFLMLKKRWLLIMSLVVIFAGVAGWYTSYTYFPMYTTTTTVLVNRQDITLGLSSSSDFYIREDLLSTFQGIINSVKLRNEVAHRLETENLGGISVSSDDSSIIRIKVTHADPELGAEVANMTAIVFQEMIKEMMYDMDSSILDEAMPSYVPQSMNLSTKVMIGAILGGMVGVGICFLREYLDKTVKSPKEVELILEIPIMGVIPDLNVKAVSKEEGKSWMQH